MCCPEQWVGRLCCAYPSASNVVGFCSAPPAIHRGIHKSQPTARRPPRHTEPLVAALSQITIASNQTITHTRARSFLMLRVTQHGVCSFHSGFAPVEGDMTLNENAHLKLCLSLGGARSVGDDDDDDDADNNDASDFTLIVQKRSCCALNVVVCRVVSFAHWPRYTRLH